MLLTYTPIPQNAFPQMARVGQLDLPEGSSDLPFLLQLRRNRPLKGNDLSKVKQVPSNLAPSGYIQGGKKQT